VVDHRPEERTVSVEQRVIDIVSEHFAYDKEKITRNTTFIEDIGPTRSTSSSSSWSGRGVRHPDSGRPAEKIKTVGEAVDYIDNAIKNKPSVTTVATRRRVVITGLGTVNPLALFRAGLLARLLAGHSGIAPITHFDTQLSRSATARRRSTRAVRR